jgi:hypothetical protein
MFSWVCGLMGGAGGAALPLAQLCKMPGLCVSSFHSLEFARPLLYLTLLSKAEHSKKKRNCVPRNEAMGKFRCRTCPPLSEDFSANNVHDIKCYSRAKMQKWLEIR